MATNLIAVLLVTSGSRGDKLLFRYPLEDVRKPKRRKAYISDGLYAARPNTCDAGSAGGERQPVPAAGISDRPLQSYTYSVLANLLAPKNANCGEAFELTVDNMVFAGHSMLAYHRGHHAKTTAEKDAAPVAPTTFLFNVVFVLEHVGGPFRNPGLDVLCQQVYCTRQLINAYHDLSRRIAIALAHEEKRCCYLGMEAAIIVGLQEELATERDTEPEEVDPVLMFSATLEVSTVAQDLRQVFESLQLTGSLRIQINKFIDVSFCLPQVPFPSQALMSCLPPTAIQLRPYHACLLLDNVSSLEQSLPIDGSPPLIRLLRAYSPLKSMLTLSHDSDLPLTQVFHLVSHLVYWRKATVIYPMCESNVYILSRKANLEKVSPLAGDFMELFGEVSLAAILSYFSLPTPLGQQHLPSGLVKQRDDLVRMVVWMLQHGLLSQVHTYVFLLIDPSDLTSENPLEAYSSQAGTALADKVSKIRRLHMSSPDTTRGHADHVSAASDQDTEAVSAEQPLHQLASQLNDSELEALLAVNASQNSEDLDLFAKLCPYFRGRHHLEEMMYYENVSRSQLQTLLDKYSRILVSVMHEDSTIAGDRL